jgi:hypothetical protein
MSINGPITPAGSNPSATFITPAVSASRLVKGVVDAVLHQDAVGADAGLTGIALFRGNGGLLVSIGAQWLKRLGRAPI